MFDSIVVFVSKLIQSTFEQITRTILTDPENGELFTTFGKPLRLQKYEILICLFIDYSSILTTSVSLESILPIFTPNNLFLCYSFAKSTLLGLCFTFLNVNLASFINLLINWDEKLSPNCLLIYSITFADVKAWSVFLQYLFIWRSNSFFW